MKDEKIYILRILESVSKIENFVTNQNLEGF